MKMKFKGYMAELKDNGEWKEIPLKKEIETDDLIVMRDDMVIGRLGDFTEEEQKDLIFDQRPK